MLIVSLQFSLDKNEHHLINYLRVYLKHFSNCRYYIWIIAQNNRIYSIFGVLENIWRGTKISDLLTKKKNCNIFQTISQWQSKLIYIQWWVFYRQEPFEILRCQTEREKSVYAKYHDSDLSSSTRRSRRCHKRMTME